MTILRSSKEKRRDKIKHLQVAAAVHKKFTLACLHEDRKFSEAATQIIGDWADGILKKHAKK